MDLIIEKINSGFHPHVKIKINGREVNALIDTGASQTFIDKKFCEEIQIPLQEDDAPHTAMGQNGLHHHTGKADIEMGEIKIPGMLVYATQFETVNKAYSQFGINRIFGIIGMDILNNFGAVINFREKKIFFDLK